MANDDDDRKASWASWLEPGDRRPLRRAASELSQQSLDSNLNAKCLSPKQHEQSSQLEQHENDHSATPASSFSPIVAFKHFFDDKFAALAQLPSNLIELRRHSREMAAVRKKALKRWAGYDVDVVEWFRDELNPGAMWHIASSKPMEQAVMLISESDWRNRHIPAEKIIALFEDADFNPNHVMETNSPWPYHYRAVASDGDRRKRKSAPASPTHWLSVNWFKHSPYSPVNLEVDTMLAEYDTKWRSAFEDLLEASLDKPMTSRDRSGSRPFSNTTVSTWRGPGLDWMLSLQCRGILPPQLPSAYMQGRVSTDHSTSAAQRDSLIRAKAHVDIYQLAKEIYDTNKENHVEARTAGAKYESRKMLLVEESELGPDELVCPRRTYYHSSEDNAYETSLAERYYRDQTSGSSEATPSPSRCPDELGQAVSQATQQPNSALADYKQALEDLEEENKRRFMLAAAMGGLESDIGEAARQQAARVFADEENGLGDDGSAGRRPQREEDDDAVARSNESSQEDLSSAWTRVLAEDLEYLMDQVDELRAEQDELRNHQRQRDYDWQVFMARQQEAHEQEQTPRMLEQGARMADQYPPPPSTLSADSNRPQVLSTLTTTQTTRLPDGSVKTTVVLKRRFTDGVEETQESTQTSFDQPGAGNDAVGQEPPKEKKSWFWS